MPSILEMDIVLKGSKPKIWRKVLVPDNLTFHALHYVIQFSMGWRNYHLYQFTYGQRFHIGVPHPEDFFYLEDSRKLKINTLLAYPNNKIEYWYDFGNDWYHNVTVKKIHPQEKGQLYPRVIGGKGACPPEDCGGIWGYAEMLDIINNHKDSVQYKGIMKWIGYEFDPTEFDKDDSNTEYFEDFKNEVKLHDKVLGYK